VGHLVHELNLVVDRLLLVSPTTERLKKQMQFIAEDLVADFGAGQKLNLCQSRFSGKHTVENMLAFDLGMRAGMRSRVQILGCSLERALPSEGLLNCADATILDWNPGHTDDEISLNSEIMRHIKGRPTLALLPFKNQGELDPAHKLRARAQYLYLEKNCSKLSVCRGTEEFLRQGLEWVLSF